MSLTGEDSAERQLFTRNQSVLIYVSEQENSAVHIAAQNLATDIHRALGCRAVLTQAREDCTVVIGTAGQQRQLIAGKGLNMKAITDGYGLLRRESYVQQLTDGVLYITGSDRRGAVYGIYDLCAQIGVSPWHYWADVPVRTSDSFVLPAGYIKADWPSVPYRGIFINDEEELEAWARLHTQNGTIGPQTYGPLFELLLRLKANYIWPAMHVNYFNGNPENGKLADRMGIVIGTSHCDMLLRSNQNEWQPWTESKGYTDAVYDYSVQGINRDILHEYWRECVEANKEYDVSFTMGMRGIHDSAFLTQAIDDNPALSEDERLDAKVKLLGEAIRNQQQMLQEVLGPDKEGRALKTFIPYKEVLTLYDRGLELPDDITLVWANDNFGHMRRYPDDHERSRSGGNGLYYHGSYWAHPGTAMSYLFINSIPLAHTGNELKKAYESGIRKLWVYNVGGLKPLEQDMDYFLQYAWEAGKENAVTDNAFRFTEQWVNGLFSGSHGTEAAEIYETFAQATNVRKLEHMDSGVFSQTAYGDEAGRRLMKLEAIYRRGNAILFKLPAQERDAFFQLILMKIHASYYLNHEFYYADRSVLSYNRGNMQAADRYTELSLRMAEMKNRMLYFYNNKMSGGKWEGILTPDRFPPPPVPQHPVRKPAIRIAGSGMRVDLWNDGELLRFSARGSSQKWIELGNQGTGSLPFSITAGEEMEWISLSEREGELRTEKRILVTASPPEGNAPARGMITVHDHKNGVAYPIQVLWDNGFSASVETSGYLEADGYVSIPASGFDRSGGGFGDGPDRPKWITVPGIGRYEGDAVMAWLDGDAEAETAQLSLAPRLEYDFRLERDGEFDLEIHRFLTLNATGKIRFGIGVDHMEPVVVESGTRDEWLGNWSRSIWDNGEKLTVRLPYLQAGPHVLKLILIDRYVTVSKLVVYTEPKRDTVMGPPGSRRLNAALTEYGAEMPDVDWNGIREVAVAYYRTDESEVPPLPALYAPREFLRIPEQTYMKCLEIPQPARGEKKYGEFRVSAGPKDIAGHFGTGKFMEQDGVIAIEAEYALEMSDNAYLTPSHGGDGLCWEHLQAETNGRTGLAMHVAQPDLKWDNPAAAPGMHYRISVGTPGVYQVWMLIRHSNSRSDSCYLSLDGIPRPLSEQWRNGNLNEYNSSHVYYWCYISPLHLSQGEHILSVLARKSQLRVDRLYITLGEEWPPVDAQWKDSFRL